jgi:hypothetical protein
VKRARGTIYTSLEDAVAARRVRAPKTAYINPGVQRFSWIRGESARAAAALLRSTSEDAWQLITEDAETNEARLASIESWRYITPLIVFAGGGDIEFARGLYKAGWLEPEIGLIAESDEIETLNGRGPWQVFRAMCDSADMEALTLQLAAALAVVR